MDASEPVHDRSLSARVAARRENPPFVYFSSSENIGGCICGKSFQEEGERGDAPPLNRLSTGNRWDTKESETIILKALGRYETPAVNRGSVSLKG